MTVALLAGPQLHSRADKTRRVSAQLSVFILQCELYREKGGREAAKGKTGAAKDLCTGCEAISILYSKGLCR